MRSPKRMVHPRACGEQALMARNAIFMSRFIPAPAGNRGLEPGRKITVPVHPRACGEQSAVAEFRWKAAFSVHPRACGEQTMRSLLLKP